MLESRQITQLQMFAHNLGQCLLKTRGLISDSYTKFSKHLSKLEWRLIENKWIGLPLFHEICKIIGEFVSMQGSGNGNNSVAPSGIESMSSSFLCPKLFQELGQLRHAINLCMCEYSLTKSSFCIFALAHSWMPSAGSTSRHNFNQDGRDKCGEVGLINFWVKLNEWQ